MEVIKGRMYDYNNGRFLSVDPFIQNPTSTQSMNPYTYIFNNPLSGTDPTGYRSSVGFGGQSYASVCVEGMGCTGVGGGGDPSKLARNRKETNNGAENSNFLFGGSSTESPSDRGNQTSYSNSENKDEPKKDRGWFHRLLLQLIPFWGDNQDISENYQESLAYCEGHTVGGNCSNNNVIDKETAKNFMAITEIVPVDAVGLLITKAATKATKATQSVRVATNVEQSFKNGELFSHVINTKKEGAIDFLSEVIIKGDTLILNDVAVFGRQGATDLTGLTKDIFRGLFEIRKMAKAQGFKYLEIKGKRVLTSSSVNPGHLVDMKMKL